MEILCCFMSVERISVMNLAFMGKIWRTYKLHGERDGRIFIGLVLNQVFNSHQLRSVQSLSHIWLFATPWTAAPHLSLSITKPWSLLKLISIESVMPYNHFIFCHSLLLPPSIFAGIRDFSNEPVLCIGESKDWNFSFSITISKDYSGLISLRWTYM